MNPNDFICMYINLDSRPDRNEQAILEFEKIKDIFPVIHRISAERFEISSFTPQVRGIIGCMSSHIKCLQIAQHEQKHLLVFEDDVEFVGNYGEIIPSAIDELPGGWDMFYLGANILKPFQQISPHLARLTHAQSTHAYFVNYNFIEKLATYFPMNQVVPIDVVYAERVVPNSNCYIVAPEMVAIQRDSISDIEGANATYDLPIQRYKENFVKMETE